MLGSRMGVGITALIGLLFISHALGLCALNEQRSYYGGDVPTFTCTGTIKSFELQSYLGSATVLKIELSKIIDVMETIKELSSPNVKFEVAEIIFSDSNITTLPSELLTIKGLKNLDVTSNNITAINLNILPYANELIKLNLSHNGIKEFETESITYISTKRLRHIDLSFNMIDHVPVNCFYSTRDSLVHLDLSHNQITSFDFYAFSSLVLLKGLRLSHNKLVNLGFFLYPMINLQTLLLDNNEIEEISTEVFDKSSRLSKLDLGYNNIQLIEDRSFGALNKLNNLNLKNNRINSIKEIIFRNNTMLSSLDLSFNNLTYIEPGTFSPMENLAFIGLERAFAMAIPENLFTGVKVNKLNFAGSTINKIEGTPFISMRHNLISLNLSSSAIHEMSETAVNTLTNLEILDLSNNNLSEIAFQTADLENLSKLYLRNNNIRELKPETFHHLHSLKELDLSNNNIQIIPPMTFKNLKNLDLFKIANNKLDSIILYNTFFGLENVQQLELIHTEVVRWDSYALSGLHNLKVLNASHGQLAYLDYYAFTGTGNIEILDLSYNQIQQFNVKLLPNTNMKEIYLNNNQLCSIQKNAFEGFGDLEILNLSYNNLVTVDSSAFISLKSLTYLDLSHNPDIKLDGQVFDNLALNTVLLRNVSNRVTFESGSVSITNLDLSSSQISNVSFLHLHNIRNLNKLDLSQNNITAVDQFSFADVMPSLHLLNFSHNNILHIKPGTFLKNNDIQYLDLSFNKLERIQFGALNGLRSLHTLNLSNNVLWNFKLTLLYNVPSVSIIFLDNNKISSLGTTEKLYNLMNLSVGGNDLSCDDLLDLKMHSAVNITAGKLDYFSENVDGISCSLMNGVIEVTPSFVIE